MLKARCTAAVRFAFRLVPTDEIIAVMHVPMFCPSIIGNADETVMAPVDVSAYKIPTEAEED